MAPAISIRRSGASDFVPVMDIWRRAVDATHDFLSAADRSAIEEEVSVFFRQASLLLAVDCADRPVGLMLLSGGHMEALFVDPGHHGQGIGRALVGLAMERHPRLTTDVNEQNVRAVKFYERLGFQRVGRSARDGQGRDYPLLHLEVAGSPGEGAHAP